MAQKPAIPKGTRDFLPAQSRKRQYIFDTATAVFQQYGYQPIETPAMENLDTLTGKYGEEGDKLIFRILNSGHYMENVDAPSGDYLESVLVSFKDKSEFIEKLKVSPFFYMNEHFDYKNLTPNIAGKALRYDLTVPFARFVVQHQNDISFPFKRYQIQPVWRADRPQKGRYREFYQCDVDVIGSDSLLNEAELLCIIDDVFTKLGLGDIVIRINNRKILSGIAESAGLSGYFTDMTVAIDKLDKIGLDGVKEDMIKRGLPEAGVKKALNLIKLEGKAEDTLRMLANALVGVQEAHKGIEEVKQVIKALPDNVRSKVQIDLTLARGLNYYTGAIIEVGHTEFPSSICGGGRYDDLTGIFGLPNVSGVGVSLGADRIFDLMEELQLFPESLAASSDALFVNFGEAEALASWKLAAELRKAGFSSEVYPDEAKMKKQMKYANDKGVHFVVMIGSQELLEGKCTVKDMHTGDQFAVLQSDLTHFMEEKTGQR